MYEKCPVCGLEVLKGSKKCPSCNTVLLDESKSSKQESLDYQKQQVATESKKESYLCLTPIDEPNHNSSSTLNSCKACGHGVSKKASKCPNCGEPTTVGTLNSCSIIFLVWLVFVFFLIFGLPKLLK